MKHIKKGNTLASKNKINITRHAEDRWLQRVLEADRKGRSLKEVAFKARYYGVNLNYCTSNDVGDAELYRCLNKYFRFKTQSNVLRYLDGYVYIYAGKHSRTLVSIVDVKKYLKQQAACV